MYSRNCSPDKIQEHFQHSWGLLPASILVSTFPKGNHSSDPITIEKLCCFRTSYNYTLCTFTCCVLFHAWFLPVGILVLESYYVAACVRSLSFSVAALYSMLWFLSQFVLSKLLDTVEGRLRCFQFEALRNNATTNILRHVFWWPWVLTLLGVCIGVELLVHRVGTCSALALVQTATKHSKVLVPVNTLQAVSESLKHSACLPALGVVLSRISSVLHFKVSLKLVFQCFHCIFNFEIIVLISKWSFTFCCSFFTAIRSYFMYSIPSQIFLGVLIKLFLFILWTFFFSVS